MPCVRTGAAVTLHGEHRSGRADRFGQGDGEQPGACVQVHDRRPGAVAGSGHDRLEERRRGAGVDLPEDAVRNPVGAGADGGVHRARRPADLPADDQAGPEVGQPQGRPAARGHRNDGLGRVGPRGHLELGGAGPQMRQGAGGVDAGTGDGAVVDVLEPVRAVAPEAHRTPAVHRQAHPAAPAEPVLVTGNRLDLHLDLAVQSGQALQLLGDAKGLEAPLGPQLHVLEVAPAAASGSAVRARGRNAVRGGGQDLDGVRSHVGGRFAGDLGPHALAGQGVADEHDLAVGRPPDAPAPGGNGSHLELHEGRGLGARHGR